MQLHPTNHHHAGGSRPALSRSRAPAPRLDNSRGASGTICPLGARACAHAHAHMHVHIHMGCHTEAFADRLRKLRRYASPGPSGASAERPNAPLQHLSTEPHRLEGARGRGWGQVSACQDAASSIAPDAPAALVALRPLGIQAPHPLGSHDSPFPDTILHAAAIGLCTIL